MRPKPLFVVIAVLLFALLPVRIEAQEEQALIMGTPVVHPYAFMDSGGAPRGFSIELAEIISTEINVEIVPRFTSGISEVLIQQATGAAQIAPGAPRLPFWQDSNVFSRPVAVEPLRLVTLAEQAMTLGTAPLEGQRIGIVPRTAGATLTDILARNQPVEFVSIQEALMALLAAEVDALLLPNPGILAIARNAGIDGRIAFAGPVLLEIERVVALHQSRAHLLPAINAAIGRIEADGRLDALRRRHLISVQTSDQTELVVGVADFPPHQIVREDGTMTGFAVEVLRDLSAQLGIDMRFEPISRDAWIEGPGGGGYDMLPQSPITAERQVLMDFTLPIHESYASIITRAGNATGIAGLDDLSGLRVGIQPAHTFVATLRGRTDIETVQIPTRDDLFDALLAGDVDAIIFATEPFRALIEARGEEEQFAIIDPPVQTTLRAPALRFGLGAVRDRLNAAIPGYLIGERYAELHARFFDPPVFWTEARIRRVAGLAIGCLAILLATIGFQVLRARNLDKRRRRDIAEAKAHATQKMGDLQGELETIFNATTSGIVALNSAGRIVRANQHARSLLGLSDRRLPADWPKGVRFVDTKDMVPLEASADPLMRALSGRHVHKETHLLNRADGAAFHVRIDSAMPEGATGDLPVVLVLDDVSEEERNRHVVERKNRLDALGQLTGGIAHDFNNLLASMLYAIDLAGSAKSVEKRAIFHATARSSVERGRELTARLLSFARRQPGLARVVSVSEVFAEFDELIRPMLEAKIEVSYDISEDGLSLFCDLTQFESALLNLVLNSRDAMLRAGKGTTIKIGARPSDMPRDTTLHDGRSRRPGHQSLKIEGHRFVAVTVTDDGPGMDAETLKRSTDPFFTTKETNSGTGLGLAMVYGFARQSHGDLMLYSEVGVGTTIQLVLPRGAPDGLREAPKERTQPPMGHGERILLVEDEPSLLSMMSEVLEDVGYSVIEAKSGKDAITAMEDGLTFDLLLTDVVMPGAIDGFELAKRVRAKYPDMPVIYTSGYAGFTASEMGEVQATLIQKPASPEELATAIQTALTAPVAALA